MAIEIEVDYVRVLFNFYNSISGKKVRRNEKNLNLIEECLKLNNQNASDIEEYMKWYCLYKNDQDLKPDFEECMREFVHYNELSFDQKKFLKHMDEIHYEKVEQIIPIDDIVISPDDARRCIEYDKDIFNELVEGIKDFGIITPICLQRTESKYEIIAGCRRLVAAKIAGLKDIPALVYDKEQHDKELNRLLSKYNITL
ncbi:putative transcriptional regulator [Lachnospiraceae bacterium JC7]|nr:putative transcriptional regulator [Lachnospiraceae bacterium JC7]